MSAPSRIVGLDIARSLAIIGMIVVHMASLLWSTKVLLSGIPSSLFAIIADVTMMIIGKNFTTTTFLRLLTRGGLVMLIGLALLPVGGEIHIVLVAMGLTMMLVSWVPPLGIWWKLALFGLATIAATVRYAPLALIQIYPLLAWIAFFLGGMLLFEVYLRRYFDGAAEAPGAYGVKTRLSVTALSAVITAVGMYYRFTPNIPGWLRFTGHTGVAGEILLSVACAAVALHACLIIGERLPRLSYPFAAMGSMSLTIYILHVLTANYWQHHIALHSTASAAGFIIFFLIFATAWKKIIGQGPAEKLVATAVRALIPAKKGK